MTTEYRTGRDCALKFIHLRSSLLPFISKATPRFGTILSPRQPREGRGKKPEEGSFDQLDR